MCILIHAVENVDCVTYLRPSLQAKRFPQNKTIKLLLLNFCSGVQS